jgi:hypothetical protein
VEFAELLLLELDPEEELEEEDEELLVELDELELVLDLLDCCSVRVLIDWLRSGFPEVAASV